MKRKKIWFFLFSSIILFFCFACEKEKTITSDFVDETTYHEVLSKKQTAFVYVTDEDDEDLVKEVSMLNELFQQTSSTVLLYNVYYRNGHTMQNDYVNSLRDTFKDETDEQLKRAFKLHTLTYVKNGEVLEVFDLDMNEETNDFSLAQEFLNEVK